MTWMKTVWAICVGFWQPSQSTPYSGQVYPTGGNGGGVGQTYPY
jgi:hypothetical protein